MKLCLAQIRVVDGEKSENLERIYKTIESARGCDLVVFPECVLGGFENTEEIAEPLGGEFVSSLKELSSEYGLGIAGSFAERADKIYDTAFLVDGNNVHTYRKRVLFVGEERIFSPGEDPPRVFEFRGRRVGFAICYEIRFPELAIPLLLSDVELLIVPAARMAPRRVSDREALIPARAVELQAFVAAANRVGGKFFGRSAIAGPSGEVYRAGRNEGLYKAEIDKNRIRETRSRIPAVRDRKRVIERLKNSGRYRLQHRDHVPDPLP